MQVSVSGDIGGGALSAAGRETAGAQVLPAEQRGAGGHDQTPVHGYRLGSKEC